MKKIPVFPAIVAMLSLLAALDSIIVYVYPAGKPPQFYVAG